MTRDSEYITSGGNEVKSNKTLRIWNLLEKKQKTFLNFDTSVESLEIDNEYNLFLWLVEKLRKII